MYRNDRKAARTETLRRKAARQAKTAGIVTR